MFGSRKKPTSLHERTGSDLWIDILWLIFIGAALAGMLLPGLFPWNFRPSTILVSVLLLSLECLIFRAIYKFAVELIKRMNAPRKELPPL